MDSMNFFLKLKISETTTKDTGAFDYLLCFEV